MLGDAKLESEGKTDRAAGKIQNAVGGVKDTLGEVTATVGFSLPGTPCFALLIKCAENSASNLLRTEIDGGSSANSRAFNYEGIQLSDVQYL